MPAIISFGASYSKEKFGASAARSKRAGNAGLRSYTTRAGPRDPAPPPSWHVYFGAAERAAAAEATDDQQVVGERRSFAARMEHRRPGAHLIGCRIVQSVVLVAAVSVIASAAGRPACPREAMTVLA